MRETACHTVRTEGGLRGKRLRLEGGMGKAPEVCGL